MTKAPEALRAAVVARYLDGTNPSGDKVADEFGVCQATVSKWVRAHLAQMERPASAS